MVRVVVALAVAVTLGGCAAVERTGGWFGGAKPSPVPEARAGATPRVYYAGVEGLKIYSEPSASSQVVGTLALHERVSRSDVQRGYAHVATSSGLTGWVSNAQLIWRLPATTASAPADEEATTPGSQAPEPEPPAEEPSPTTSTTTPPRPAPPTSTTLPPPGVPPSIFNPY